MPPPSSSLAAAAGGSALAVLARPGLTAQGAPARPLHLAVGMFDGVHLGHQAVIRQAVEAARGEDQHASAVLTFDPHPSRVLYPERATSLLMPLEQRIHKIHAAGVDYVFVQPFTRSYALQRAADFVPGLVQAFPQLRSLHVGENFRFGAGRSGDVATLAATAEAAGVALHALRRELLDGMAISSSRIRLALIEGAMDEVQAMLGHPYVIEGRIQPGKGLGRQLDFPTLNVPWAPEVLPRFGVYRVLLQGPHNALAIPGVANYGLRPTVDRSTDPLLEVHLLDSSRLPAQGERVKVALMAFMRPETAFPSIEALHRQIALDVARARQAGPTLPGLQPFPF